ncbi:MAG TPA: YhdP family protein [Burkholderiales bacterium]|nr:YhdP family protein [Burkholderiales bacterium]
MQSSHRRTAARKLLRALEWLAWGAFFAFAAVFLALRFWLLPQVERYREEVVAALTRAVGLPVQIGTLNAEWDGLHPRLTLTQVRIADRDGREALVLPSIEPAVGWATLFTGELRLYSLTIDRPRLRVRRAADGTLSVAGLGVSAGAVSGGGDGNSHLADWILEQREIIVRDAEIEWVDEQRGAPPLVLRGLQLRLRNRGDLHQAGLSAHPPPELGAGLELRLSLQGRSVRQLAAWNGRVYAELGYTDLAGWRPWIDYPLDVSSGQGALRLWATFGGGKLVDATADLALAGVTAKLGKGLPVLALQSVAGRVQGRATIYGYEFGAQRLALVPVSGLPMQGTTFRARWEETDPPRGALSADTLELEPLAQLAEYLPFPADLRALLAELAPQGRVADASFEWTGRLPDDARFRARARFEGLGMNAWRRVPGFRNLTGRIEASESGGSLTLAARDAEVDLPRVFPEPRIRLALLAGNVGWERPPGRELTVRIGQLQFANQDAAGTAAGTYAWTGEGPGRIDLTAQLQRADAQGLDRYLPRAGILPGAARDWLVHSIRAGRSSDTRVRLRGDLRDFPFRDPAQGEFLIVAQVRDAELAYAPGWPAFRQIDGELRFEADRMQVAARRAEMLGARVREARVALTFGPDPVLAISGNADGPTASFLRFLRESPLHARVGEFLGDAQAVGDGELRLGLQLPIADIEKFELSGEYRFAGNTLRLGSRLPSIDRVAGTLAFTGDSIDVRSASGRVLGGAVRLLGGTQRGGDVVLNASGAFTVAALEPWLPEAWRGRLRGGAPYAGSVRVRRGAAPQFTVESELVGVSSDLPPPLAKPAERRLLLRVSLLHGDDPDRDRISVALEPLMRAEFLRGRQGGSMAVERAAIAFHPAPGTTLRMPELPARVLLYGSLPHLDLDSWLDLLRGDGDGGAGEEGGMVADMSFGQLDVFGRRMEDLKVSARIGAGGWRAKLSSAAIEGDVQFRTSAPRSVLARMTRFTVPPLTSEPVAGGGRGEELPDLDLVADDFVYRSSHLGRVELLARREDAEWRLERIHVKNPDGEVTGTGEWRTAEDGRTALDLKLDLPNAGGFLTRMGYPNLVSKGNVTAAAQLSWQGEPTSVDKASLSGTVKLHAEQGQFLKIEPGIGKLISLISLQNLPRRVFLDFGDVFSKGFAWDVIDATAKVERGVLETKDFRMTGGAAEVEMQGTVDLAAETQDLRVRVIPGLDGSAATVTGVLVSPPVGLAALFAQKILRNPLGQMFAYRYEIKGDWAEPKVEKLNLPPAQLPKEPIGD